MKMNNPELLHAVMSARRVLLITHVSPDGDAIGSTLAMGRALVNAGKDVAIVCDDPVPRVHAALPDAEHIVPPEQVSEMSFDLALAIDAADELRLGRGIQAFRRATLTAQIDHHGTNTNYADINEVDEHSGAAGVMVFRFLRMADIDIDPRIARCLYTAIASDTGNFTFPSTTPEIFKTISKLLKTGFPLSEDAERLFRTRELAHVKLLARALSSLRISEDGRLAGMCLSLDDFSACGALHEHSDKIVNYGTDIEGVGIAFLLTEAEDCVRCSLRAHAPYQVSAIAKQLGGGGHSLAAGCSIQLPLTEAFDMVSRLAAQALAVPQS